LAAGVHLPVGRLLFSSSRNCECPIACIAASHSPLADTLLGFALASVSLALDVTEDEIVAGHAVEYRQQMQIASSERGRPKENPATSRTAGGVLGLPN
jgi:hypothetical protein